MSRSLSAVFLIAWALVLAIPLILTTRQIELAAPVDENRTKVEWPSMPQSVGPTACFQYAQGIQNWFEDNFGGRDAMIRLKTQIDFTVFNKSDRIHLGKNGFMFYRSLLDERIPHLERSSAELVQQRVQGLEALGSALKEQGVTLIVMPIPLKFSVYPELLPRSAPSLPDHRVFHKFREMLSNSDHLILFDAYPRMMALKTKLNVFNLTDFHWSEPAAREIGDQLLDKIAQESGFTGHVSIWPRDYEVREFSGGQAQFMPLLQTPSERATFTKVGPPYPHEGKAPPIEWAVHASPTVEHTPLPPTVFIGDSFVWALHNTGFTTGFSSFFFSHVRNDGSQTLYQNLPKKTRFVILELLEHSYLVDYSPQ